MKQDMRRLVKALWIKACRYDGIDPTARFIIFSDENPHLPRYNKMMALYQNVCGGCHADITEPDSPINAPCYTHS